MLWGATSVKAVHVMLMKWTPIVITPAAVKVQSRSNWKKEKELGENSQNFQIKFVRFVTFKCFYKTIIHGK
jgi:hypothetical protein